MSCENYGVVNGASCDCPPGFGGSTCAQPACGGNIFQGSGRSLAPLSFANLSGCACENGWTGTGCNVCQSANACQSAYVNTGGANAGIASSGTEAGENNTLTCNVTPRVYAASQMSCEVVVRIHFMFYRDSALGGYSAFEMGIVYKLSICFNCQQPADDAE